MGRALEGAMIPTEIRRPRRPVSILGIDMSYGSKLLLAFGLLLGLVLGLAGLSVWGNHQTQFLFERARLAHKVNEGYLTLSSNAYQLFKKQSEAQLTGEDGRGENIAAVKTRLRADVRRLRQLIASEIAFVEEDEQESEKEELLMLAQIERQFESILIQFAEAQRLRAAGREAEALTLLDSIFKESIEGRFNVLIAEAIAEESEEVAEADAEAAELMHWIRLVVQLLAGLGVVFGLLFAVLLLRGLRDPLVQLLAGTRALRKGELQHRIDLDAADEFGELAQSFNRMAAELEGNKRALEASKSDLEQAVAARTGELRDANAALERADQIRRRFFADISHELRTPLTIIRGESEIVLRGQDKSVEDYKGSLQRVLDQAKHTGRLVDDLLFVARQDAGETRMARQAVALREIVESVSGDAEILAEKRGIKVTLNRDVEEAVVSGDPGRLRQLFLILIDNAVRYSEAHGEVGIYIGPAAKGVVVRVSDQGIGIAPDELDRIFERFYRGDNASEHHAEGTGLGLPVAKAIADAHGGELDIQSRLGEGTTAIVTLPVVRKLRAVA